MPESFKIDNNAFIESICNSLRVLTLRDKHLIFCAVPAAPFKCMNTFQRFCSFCSPNCSHCTFMIYTRGGKATLSRTHIATLLRGNAVN